MANSFAAADGFFDSEDLMSWLLLNPDMVEYDETHNNLGPLVGEAPYQQQPYYAPQGPAVMQHDSTNNHSFHNDIPVLEETHAAAQLPVKEEASKRTHKAAKTKPDQSAHGGTKITRKRQRESVEDIEARVNELRGENADLQAHLMNVTQRTNEVQKQRQAMERLMINKLAEVGDRDDIADQSDLAKVVKQYTDIYADYGKCRQREVQFHLNQLEKLLLPTKTTKMSLWALQQDKSFFQKNKSPMFDLLSKELELTTEQTEKIQERREKTVELLGQLKESLSLIGTLKTAIEKKHSSYDSICGRVQEAATPKQTVIFLRWIAAHAEELASYIPSFSRNVHHMPNVNFVDGVASPPTRSAATPANEASCSSGSSASQQNELPP
ncbi:hypothetical protein B484DRAFT_451343 [Ochromonadaceae sp. CCMP2298]|nr:hypothetical protein B484DRAFT_451343 [Ochromonadaceae sp. CCMP2298]|mmetsp:Transcript_30216/g.66882  ORF Transcript_30216/g.66882 Transcript_30216/m.66882 type:complete len:382 (-) Transcript_30216:65-1210(-)